MTLGMGELEECNYAHVSIVQPSTINYPHLPSLQDDGNLHTYKTSKSSWISLLETHKAK